VVSRGPVAGPRSSLDSLEERISPTTHRAVADLLDVISYMYANNDTALTSVFRLQLGEMTPPSLRLMEVSLISGSAWTTGA
jgi:hypothetical protein